MFSNDLFTEDLIEVNKECLNWEEAISLGAKLLFKKNYINSGYENAIIKNIKDLGPYMVIMPNVILSHARPEDGVNKTSISFVTLKNSIKFGSNNDPVKLVITLASINNNEHLEILTKLICLFRNQKDLDKIFKSKNKSEIVDILKKY